MEIVAPFKTVKYSDYRNNAIERGQMLPRQGEMGENTPFTRKCTSEPSETLEWVTTRTLIIFLSFS